MIDMINESIRSSLPLHLIPGVGCGGVVLLGGEEPDSRELPNELELKALLCLENSSNAREAASS